MLRFLKYGLWLSLAALAVATVHYHIWRQKLSIESHDSVAAIAQTLVERRFVPGLAYAVIRQGQVVEVAQIGLADASTGRELTPDTLFEAASLTKPVIAEISRRLYRDGIFALDESVAATISNPRVAEAAYWQQVTPRHLLSHTAGFPNWSGDSRVHDRQNKLKQDFVPGTEFQYSGEGYGLLLEFLEAKSGKSIVELSETLFQALGMNQSTLIAATVEGDFARGHWIVEPGRQPWRTDRAIAAYSLFTTPKDYARFVQHTMLQLRQDAEFAKPSIEFESGPDGSQLGWALGWGVLIREDDTLYYQWGDNGPFKALAMFELTTGDGLVYFCNGSLGTVFASELADPIFADVSTASNWFSSPLLEYIRPLIGL